MGEGRLRIRQKAEGKERMQTGEGRRQRGEGRREKGEG
jgi:hypothetical protein